MQAITLTKNDIKRIWITVRQLQRKRMCSSRHKRTLFSKVFNKKYFSEKIDLIIDTNGFVAKNVCNKSLGVGDEIAILSMEIVRRITARLLYILAFPAFVTLG